MKIRIFPFLLFVSFIIIFFIFYKGLHNSNIYIPQNNSEKDIPQFSAQIFNTTKEISSENIFKKDQFYLMNIWASWCVPCVKEHPFLMNLMDQKNLDIIGMNYKDNNDKANFFLKKFNNPYKIIILDKDGTIAIEWGAYGVPETFLIYDNKIIKKFIGPLNENSLIEIKKLIK